MMRIVAGVIGAAVLLGATSASAEKLTLACTLESGDFERERDVNEVIFDTDRPRVDLRVAQSMGTNNPVDWTFENNAERKDSIQMVSEGSKISVAAIRYGHAVVISFDRITGLLNWAFADGSRSFRYKCRWVIVRLPSFIEPCQSSKVTQPPSGPLYVHEIKHYGYRGHRTCG